MTRIKLKGFSLSTNRLFRVLLRFLLFLFYSSAVICVKTLLLAFASGAKGTRGTRVLVKTDEIGDFVIWLNDYMRFQRDSDILITTAANAQLASEMEMFSEIISFNKKDVILCPHRFLSFLCSLMQVRTHNVVNCVVSRNSIYSDLICLAVDAVVRTGASQDFKSQSYIEHIFTQIFYNQTIDLTEYYRHHVSIRNVKLLLAVSRSEPKATKKFTFAKRCNESLSDEFNDLKDSSFVLIAAGSKQNFKRWSPDNFSMLAGFFARSKNIEKIVLVGDDKESQVADYILRNVQSDKVINLCGHTTLTDLVSLISVSKLVLSNDSAVAHIGVWQGVSTFVVLGGGHYGEFFPYPDKDVRSKYHTVISKKLDCFNCNWNCRYQKDADGVVRCLSSLSGEEVLKVIEEADQILS